MIRSAVKRIMKAMLGEYSIYRIFESPVGSAEFDDEINQDSDLRFLETNGAALEAAEADLMREQSWYGGSGAWVFACEVENRIVATSIVWYGERYKTRNFWPLKPDEAKLVQVVVDNSIRSRGVGTKLIRYTAAEVAKKGIRACYARIWHSNAPSIAAFKKAGWAELALVVEFHLFNRAKATRLTWPRQ